MLDDEIERIDKAYVNLLIGDMIKSGSREIIISKQSNLLFILKPEARRKLDAFDGVVKFRNVLSRLKEMVDPLQKNLTR